MLNENTLLYGSPQLPPQPITLRAGNLSMLFEPDNAFLRYIRFGDHEVIRSVYAVVRDQNWNTIPWKVRNLQAAVRADSFEITFDVDCDDGRIRYEWRGAIHGTADGQVSFSFDGEAKSDFLRNRIGICVLHPISECAGQPCRLEHTDGSVEQTRFPKEIAPWQPLRDVRAIGHVVSPGVEAEVRFDGEVFETEDQRNFGDASFKTYSTPQDLPKPVQVKTGDRVTQRALISLSNSTGQRAAAPNHEKPARITLVGKPFRKPAIGLQLNRDGQRLTAAEAERIRALKLAHVRADLMLAAPDWREKLDEATAEADMLDLPLELGIHLGADLASDLMNLINEVKLTTPDVSLWIVHRRGEAFPSSATIAAVKEKFDDAGIKAPIAAAASPFYIEMNRNRPASGSAALPCIPFAPQVHLTDRFTLIENLADVSEMIDSAAAMTNGRVVVSPITLRRSEPKPTVLAALTAADLPATVDPRQMSLFAAGWTIGHYAHLAADDRLHSATYYETIGWRGVMECEVGSALPDKFLSFPGAVFPIYHVFADIAEFSHVVKTRSTLPLQVQAITLADGAGKRCLLVANLLAVEQTVQVDTGSREVRLRRMNAHNAESAMRRPEPFRAQPGEALAVSHALSLNLAAYEVARVDWSI